MMIKLERLRLFVHPKDQQLGKKKIWKYFHLQITTEINKGDEAEKKQTGCFPRTDPVQAGLALLSV